MLLLFSFTHTHTRHLELGSVCQSLSSDALRGCHNKTIGTRMSGTSSGPTSELRSLDYRDVGQREGSRYVAFVVLVRGWHGRPGP